MTPTAQRTWTHVISRYPSWADYFGTIGGGELEVAVPAPAGSSAGHLVVFTNGEDVWLRYAPGCMCYAVDDEEEMFSIIEQLLDDQALFVVTMNGDAWAGTTLITRDKEPTPEAGHTAHVVSWSGRYDRVIEGQPTSAPAPA
jgi:hypothetical protein